MESFIMSAKKTRGRREDNAYIEMKVPDILFPTIEKYLSSNPNDEYLFLFIPRWGKSH